jgi:hypothetical protein
MLSGAKPRVLRSAHSLSRNAQARGAHHEESDAISLPYIARRGPAQARGAQPEESIAISLPRPRAPSRTLRSRAEPRRIVLTRRSKLLANTLKHFAFDVWARANVLAFSCERTGQYYR